MEFQCSSLRVVCLVTPTHLSGWVGFLLTFKKVLGPVRTTVTLRVPTVSIGEIVELPLRHCQVVLTKLNSIPA